MKRWIAAMVITLVSLAVQDLDACPNCKKAFAPGTPDAKLGEAYSSSVLFMLVMPVAVVTGVSLTIFASARKALKAKQAID